MEKRDITVDVVAQLLREQYPRWAGLPIRAVDVDGNDNTTFRLGDALLARLPSHDRYVAGVEKEHRWLPFLAPRLPLPIPEPVAKGRPSPGTFPRVWSIYRWLAGEPADASPPADRVTFARDVAEFLNALRHVDTTDAPLPGEQNFWRGAPLARYDRQTRQAVHDLGDAIDGDAALAVWDAAMDDVYTGTPVWVHGDVAAGNLLVGGGRLAAVIDFGTAAVGDPACDTVLAWTFLDGPSRLAFRDQLHVDAATWVRGRGWALWKAVITLAWNAPADAPLSRRLRAVLDAVIAEHRTDAG